MRIKEKKKSLRRKRGISDGLPLKLRRKHKPLRRAPGGKGDGRGGKAGSSSSGGRKPIA